MATGINIDPSISLGIKPPATMSLSDMLNVARGAQLYQTERQLQPEQIRQMQMKTQLESATMPETIQQAQIATRTAGSQETIAGIGAKSAQFTFDKAKTDALNNIIGGYRNDPRVSSGDSDQAVDAVNEIKTRARALGIPASVLERISAQAMGIALDQPNRLAQYFDNVIQSQLGAQGQQALQTGPVVEFGGQPGMVIPATKTIQPMTMGGAQPSAQPSAQPPANVQPSVGVQPAVGVTPSDMTAPIAARAPLMYPVRREGQPFTPTPEELADRTTGSAVRNSLVQRQSELVTARRNLQEVVKTAKKLQEESMLPETGVVGALKRNIATQLGDPTYKQLSKDLANVQISNIQAMGGSLNTDSGKELARMATGDETFPPEVLLSIARRADADITNLDLMATGLQKHSQRYGDANTKRFQQMWSANADSRIFEMMNIARDVKDPRTRQEMTNKLLGNMDQNQREQLVQQYQNLIKLSKTGDL
jgi:hypothetical protein